MDRAVLPVENARPDRATGLRRHCISAGPSVLWRKQPGPDIFRQPLQELSVFLFVEASRAWETKTIEIETPLAPIPGAVLAKPVVLVPILRAGLGMLDGIQRIAPEAAIGHIGPDRDAETPRPGR